MKNPLLFTRFLVLIHRALKHSTSTQNWRYRKSARVILLKRLRIWKVKGGKSLQSIVPSPAKMDELLSSLIIITSQPERKYHLYFLFWQLSWSSSNIHELFSFLGGQFHRDVRKGRSRKSGNIPHNQNVPMEILATDHIYMVTSPYFFSPCNCWVGTTLHQPNWSNC